MRVRAARAAMAVARRRTTFADVLARQGKLTDPAWRAAVAAVPRHRLVPQFWTQDATGAWRETDTTSAPPQDWLELVYANKVLASAGTGAQVRGRRRTHRPAQWAGQRGGARNEVLEAAPSRL